MDDGDLMEVLFNFGQSAGGTISWEYTYDVWGNLVEAFSPAAGRYRALYDALGRRVGQQIVRDTGATQITYYVYEGDTIVAEVDGSGRLVAEYVWGLLGPIARIDYRRPEDTRYYVIDGLGHVRALVAPNGTITEAWHYDSWGNILSMPTQRIEQPFLWNGAYGYEYIAFTGLYHIGAREYDPRTARWLQRDPIDVAGGHPNVYLYCLNNPLNLTDPDGFDPTSTKLLELVQLLLDIIGLLPGVGEAADLANAAIYLARLDVKNALISLAGVASGVGDALKIGRFARYICRVVMMGCAW